MGSVYETTGKNLHRSQTTRCLRFSASKGNFRMTTGERFVVFILRSWADNGCEYPCRWIKLWVTFLQVLAKAVLTVVRCRSNFCRRDGCATEHGRRVLTHLTTEAHDGVHDILPHTNDTTDGFSDFLGAV